MGVQYPQKWNTQAVYELIMHSSWPEGTSGTGVGLGWEWGITVGGLPPAARDGTSIN